MRGWNQQTDQHGAPCHVHLHLHGGFIGAREYGSTHSTSFIFALPYLSQAFYFERDDVDLKGFAKFFRDSAKEEYEHAEKFMKFQTDRGGRIVLQDIKKPEKDEWGTGLDAMEAALALEKNVNQALLDLHTISDSRSDFHVCISEHGGRSDYYITYLSLSLLCTFKKIIIKTPAIY